MRCKFGRLPFTTRQTLVSMAALVTAGASLNTAALPVSWTYQTPQDASVQVTGTLHYRGDRIYDINMSIDHYTGGSVTIDRDQWRYGGSPLPPYPSRVLPQYGSLSPTDFRFDVSLRALATATNGLIFDVEVRNPISTSVRNQVFRDGFQHPGAWIRDFTQNWPGPSRSQPADRELIDYIEEFLYKDRRTPEQRRIDNSERFERCVIRRSCGRSDGGGVRGSLDDLPGSRELPATIVATSSPGWVDSYMNIPESVVNPESGATEAPYFASFFFAASTIGGSEDVLEVGFGRGGFTVSLGELVVGKWYLAQFVLPEGILGTEQVFGIELSNSSGNLSEVVLTDLVWGTEAEFAALSAVPVPGASILMLGPLALLLRRTQRSTSGRR